MKKIFSIIKKFTIPIIITIILLIIQANLDLSLPDYTANIINIGIQKKGIVYVTPEVLTKKTYDNLSKVMDNSILENAYELKSLNAFENKEKIKETYPLLEQEDLYFLKQMTNEEKETLEENLVKPFIFIKLLETNNEQIVNNIPIKIPDNISLLDYYFTLPTVEQEKLKTMYDENINSYESSMLNQMGAEYVKEEYSLIKMDLDKLQMDYIYHNGFIMIILALSLMISAILVSYMASRIATKFSYELRNKVVSKIMSFSSKEFNEFSLASLITRSTNDIQQIQMMFMMFFRVIIFAPILGFGALFKVLGNSMTWVLALAIGLILFLIIFLFIFVMPKFKLIQKLVDRLNLVSRERITGVPVIRAFAMAPHEEKKFDKANVDLAKTMQFCDRAMGVMMPTMMFIMNGVSILIVYAGSKQIDLGNLQVGTLMAFMTYAIQVIMSFLMISMVSIMLPRAMVSIKRIAEILNKENSIKEKETTNKFKTNEGLVEFDHVSFKYPDADKEVLQDITFTAKKGTTTAIIGSTGSGKSTLIHLIPRFFDVTKGSIKVDHENIKDVDIHELRDRIGYVPQKGILFKGDIKSNVLFGVEENDEVLNEALEIAQASEFVNKLKDGTSSFISGGGTNVSGGQRQRLSIARALAKKAKILIFDDSFSALDFKTDANLRKALKAKVSDTTIFIVAQRISTILHADQIIVLDNGKMVGKGTHKELLKTCDVYKEIALSQLKESELDA